MSAVSTREASTEEHPLITCIRKWCAAYNRAHAYYPQRLGTAALSVIAAFLCPDGPIHVALLYTGSMTIISLAVWRPPLRMELLRGDASVPDDLLLAVANSNVDCTIKAQLGVALQKRGYIRFEELFRAAHVAPARPGRSALQRCALQVTNTKHPAAAHSGNLPSIGDAP
jgi:hypothetical protein